MFSNRMYPEYINNINFPLLMNALDAVEVVKHKTNSGSEITLFKYGNPLMEKMVLLPPYGVSYLLLSKIVKALSEKFYVLSWESKGCPDHSVAIENADFSLPSQLDYFMNILNQENFTPFHFVGWCQAAQFLVYAMAKSNIEPQTVSWIAPAGLGCALVKSEFERCALPIYLQIAREGISCAEKLAQMLNKHKEQPYDERIVAEKLAMFHLNSPDLTYRFSQYMKAYENNKLMVKPLLGDVFSKKKVLILHCKDDTYSHFSESVQLNKRYDNVSLQLFPTGGHLQLFNDPTLLSNSIIDWIASEIFN
jgi:hypothetical protein